MLIHIGNRDFEVSGRYVSAGERVVLYFPDSEGGPEFRVVVLSSASGRLGLDGYYLDENPRPNESSSGMATPLRNYQWERR